MKDKIFNTLLGLFAFIMVLGIIHGTTWFFDNLRARTIPVNHFIEENERYNSDKCFNKFKGHTYYPSGDYGQPGLCLRWLDPKDYRHWIDQEKLEIDL